MKLNYHKNLDGIRALAALMVMVFHFFQGIEPVSKNLMLLKKASVFGQTGVTLFFVLSGFLITRILLFTKTDQAYFKNFYIRRILRIFPLYYLFLVLFYYAFPLILNYQTPSFGQQVYYFLYLQNFATTFNWNAIGPDHFWSLAVEEHFYLFWPIVVYTLSVKNLSRVIAFIMLSTIILRAIMLNDGYNVFFFTFTRIDSLAIGALLAILEIRNYFSVKNSLKFLYMFVGVMVPTLFIWISFTGEGNHTIQIFKYTLLSLAYFALIGYTISIKRSHLMNKILESGFFTYTGKISYGLYVYHPFAYALVGILFQVDNLVLSFFLRLALTYIIASLSYYFFELKFLNLKKYFDSTDK